MATAGDLIRGSLRLIGQLAEGETPSNETYDDALSALNQLLDSLSTESLEIYTLSEQEITWPATYATRTFGATGQISGTRPIRVEDSSYIVVDGISYPLVIVTRPQYNTISAKETTAEYPMFLCVDATVPNSTLTVYPVPTQSIEMHLFSHLALTEPATIYTNLVIPPGYMRFFRYKLALELAAEFGVEPPAVVAKIAETAMNAIEKINAPNHLMVMPPLMPGVGRASNIYTGDA